MLLRIILQIFLLFSIFPVSSYIHGHELQPYQLIRSVILEKEKILNGNGMSVNEFNKYMGLVGRTILDHKFGDSHDRRNIQYISLFIIMGGDVRLPSTTIQKLQLADVEIKILQSAILFNRGEFERARRILGEIDVNNIDRILAGAISLLRASVEIDRDDKVVNRFYDLARLFAPGTQFDEAALRGQILFNIRKNQTGNIRPLLRLYNSRFKQSPFADSFRKKAMTELLKLNDINSEVFFELTNSLSDRLPKRARIGFILDKTRSFLMHGDQASARRLTEYIAHDIDDDILLQKRRELYSALTNVSHLRMLSVFSLREFADNRFTDEDFILLEIASALQRWLRGLDIAYINSADVNIPSTAVSELLQQNGLTQALSRLKEIERNLSKLEGRP